MNRWGELVYRFPRHAKVAAVSKSLEIARLAVTGKEEEGNRLTLTAVFYRQALARLAGQEEAAGRATQMLLTRFPESYEAQMALFVNGAVAKARGQRAEA